MQNRKPSWLGGARGQWEPRGLGLGLAGAGEKRRGRHSPKQAPRVCHHQLDSMAVTELTHLQLVLQGSVGKDHHL